MKKYNLFNTKFVLFGLVLPILLFFISYSAVYAYFTSSFNQYANTTSAVVKIGFKETNSNKISHTISKNSVVSNETTLMPGRTLTTNVTIVNEGNVDVYSIFHFIIQIEKTNGETEIVTNNFYTYSADGSISKLITSKGLYTDPSCLLSPEQEVSISVSKYFKGSEYGNEYKNAKVIYTVTAYAIQTAGVNSAVNATNLMANSENSEYKNVQIFGNSVQNGTPTIDEPVEIQSVGEKTVNLFDMSVYSTSKTGSGVTVSYLADEDCLLINGTATLTNPEHPNFAVATTYLNEPITKGINYMVSTTYLSGTITKPTDDSYCMIYFGGSDTINTSHNWRACNLKQENTANDNSLVCNYDYLSCVWLYLADGVVFNNYKVKVQVQEGDVVTEYEPYGYKIPLQQSFSIKDTSLTPKNYYILENFNMQYSSDSISYIVPCDANAKYTISHNNDNNSIFRIGYINIDESELPTVTNVPVQTFNTIRGTTEKSLTINTGSDATYLIVQVQAAQHNITRETLKIERSINIYLDQPLRKVGNYIDYIDFATGNVVRNVRSLELAVADMNNGDNNYPGWTGLSILKTDFGTVNTYLNTLTTYLTNIRYENSGVGINTSNTGLLMLLQATFGMYQADWIADYPDLVVEVCYGMPTPEIESIDLPDIFSYNLESITINTSISAQVSIIN